MRGKHNFKIGWDIRRLRTFGNDLAGTNGSYYFNRSQTADPAGSPQPATHSPACCWAPWIRGLRPALPYTSIAIRYGYHGGSSRNLETDFLA